MEAWDLTTRSRRFRVRPLRNVVHCAIHPDEHRIVIKNTVGHIALLDASDGALVRKLDRRRGTRVRTREGIQESAEMVKGYFDQLGRQETELYEPGVTE
ncbi:hypothetical protein [Peristeroidobacter agariperforans]|uniref:hypothetical protein n=1 Tax=Peristeroidobacter agariperforans TaxID=268404 RepID=UPI00101E182E|nr:hypothetical protein [Peristeroidobacter agariperforans]